MKRHLVLGAALLLSPGARAEPRQELTAGLSMLFQQGTLRSAPNHMLAEVLFLRTAAEQGPWSAFQFGGGVRVGWPRFEAPAPLEGFLRLQLSSRLGLWRPAAGFELGLTGLNQRLPDTFLPDSRLPEEEERRLGPAYGAFIASPARFYLSRFELSTLRLSLGTGLKAPGSDARIQLELLSFGGLL